MDLDADFDLAAELLEGGGAVVEAQAQAPAAGGIDMNFDMAAQIVEASPAPQPLGFQQRGRASAAFARQCLATQRANAKVEALEAKLKEMKTRLPSATVKAPPRRADQRQGTHFRKPV